MERAASIYTLADPATGEVRYVGKTVRTLAIRLSQHVSDVKRGRQTWAARWIRSLGGGVPVIAGIVQVPESMSAYAESDLIALLRADGARLTNLTDGGEGRIGYVMPAESKAKIGAANAGRPREPYSAERRAKMGAALKGKPRSAEVRAKISASKKGAVFSAEHRENIGAARRGRVMGPLSGEHRKKISIANSGKVRTPEMIARIGAAQKGKVLSPEHRAKIAAANRARYATVHAKGSQNGDQF